MPGKEVKSVETIVEDLGGRWGGHGIIELIRHWRKSHFLADSDLAWISADNQRQLIWLANELSALTAGPPPHLQPSVPYTLLPANLQPENRYAFVIAAIDTLPTTIEDKRNNLSLIRRKWGFAQLPRRQTKWLDVRNTRQMDWAIDYIGTCQLRRRQHIGFTFPHSDANRDKHAHVLGFLDHLYGISPDTQELFINKMRKTWSQRKYRESDKARKQVYFSLSEEAMNQLHQLEKERLQTKNRIIEDLLAQATRSKFQN